MEKNKIVEKRIKKITIKENQDVYDLTTANNHNFFANNILVHNCSELPLSERDSCRLLLLNLYSYVDNPFTKESKFNFDKFYKHSQIAQRFMDNIVDLEDECVTKIIKKIKNDPEPMEIKRDELKVWKEIRKFCREGRRTGTGVNAVGDMLAACGYRYGSKESIDFLNKIFKKLKLGCYRSSVDMAKELGYFKDWNYDLEKNNPFLLRIKNEDDKLYKDMKKYGRRNIACQTMAPSGSISILTQTTSGIEPLFKMSYRRRKKVNDETSANVDFIDESGDKWHEFEIIHPKIKEWKEITGENDIKKSPWHGCCANDIDWQSRVKLQGTINKNIDHSISSCITSNSLIETNNGLFYFDELTNLNEIPIDSFIKNNKEIKVLNCDMKYVKINEYYNNGTKPVLKLTLLNGLKIECTSNEQFIVLDDETGIENWKRISEIKEGDKIKIKTIDHN